MDHGSIILEKENIFFCKEKKTQKKKEEYIWRKIMYIFCRGRETWEKTDEIFGDGKYSVKKKLEGKGGKYFENENIFFAEV